MFYLIESLKSERYFTHKKAIHRRWYMAFLCVFCCLY